MEELKAFQKSFYSKKQSASVVKVGVAHDNDIVAINAKLCFSAGHIVQ